MGAQQYKPGSCCHRLLMPQSRDYGNRQNQTPLQISGKRNHETVTGDLPLRGHPLKRAPPLLRHLPVAFSEVVCSSQSLLLAQAYLQIEVKGSHKIFSVFLTWPLWTNARRSSLPDLSLCLNWLGPLLQQSSIALFRRKRPSTVNGAYRRASEILDCWHERTGEDCWTLYLHLLVAARLFPQLWLQCCLEKRNKRLPLPAFCISALQDFGQAVLYVSPRKLASW